MKHARSAGRTPASGTGSSGERLSTASQSWAGPPPTPSPGLPPAGRPPDEGGGELRKIATDGRTPPREIALHDDDLRPRVGQLVAQEVALVGGVDGHLDRAQLERGEER